MQFIDKKLQEYCSTMSTNASDLLVELERQTHLRTLSPRMISGFFQGRFLSMISRIKQPTYIVEIGTFTGYAAICLSEGLTVNGRLVTIELDKEYNDIHESYIGLSPQKEKIQVEYGDALNVIPNLDQGIDLVFIDASKKHYQQYVELLLPKMAQGGLMIADNTLWNGDIIKEMSAKAKTMHQFNTWIHQLSEVDNLLLPIRDGLTMMLKK